MVSQVFLDLIVILIVGDYLCAGRISSEFELIRGSEISVFIGAFISRVLTGLPCCNTPDRCHHNSIYRKYK